MTFVNTSTPMAISLGALTHVIPAIVKFGGFFIFLAILRIAGEFVWGMIVGEPAEALPEGAVHGEWSSCPECGLRHGPRYKGTHPLTE
jgi:hypothetical protein